MSTRAPTPADDVVLRQIANQSTDVDPRFARRLVELALAEPFRDGFRLTPLGCRRYEQLARAPLQTSSVRVIESILDRAIPAARAAGIVQPESGLDANSQQ